MRIGIVDDAAEDRKLIRREMDRCLEGSGMESAEYTEFDSGESLLAVYQEGMFDLLFLDVFMGDITGTETGIAIRKLDRHVKIIFITSSNDFASESYRAKASYYLLKPHTYAQFHEMFPELALTPDLGTPGSFLALPDGTRIAYGDIVYTDYHNHYVYFHCSSTAEVRRAYMSQNEIEGLLCSRPGFISCSRGIIVNFDKIRRFTDSVLSMQNGDTVPVSRRRLREVKDAYAEYVFLKWTIMFSLRRIPPCRSHNGNACSTPSSPSLHSWCCITLPFVTNSDTAPAAPF